MREARRLAKRHGDTTAAEGVSFPATRGQASTFFVLAIVPSWPAWLPLVVLPHPGALRHLATPGEPVGRGARRPGSDHARVRRPRPAKEGCSDEP
jgi:hypothetical protein